MPHRLTSAEGHVTMDWAAVASTIEVRMVELGLNQRELADRAGVALSIVRELRHNTVQRHRNGRTLEAISTALDLHPRHLANILIGNHPPATPTSDPAQLTRIEDRLNEILHRIAAIDTKLTQLLKPTRHDTQYTE